MFQTAWFQQGEELEGGARRDFFGGEVLVDKHEISVKRKIRTARVPCEKLRGGEQVRGARIVGIRTQR